MVTWLRRLGTRPGSILSIGYIAALAVIALMAIGAHFVLREAISEQQTTATVVSMSAQQRTLSQRIALFAERYLDERRPVFRAALERAIDEMERDHQRLTQGAPEFGVPAEIPPEILEIYFETPHELDRRVGTFVRFARTMLDVGAVNEAVREAAYEYIMREASGPLPESLNTVVKIYEAQSAERITSLERLQDLVLLVIILTLLAEAFLVFRPLVRRVQADSARLFELAMTDTLTGASNRRSFLEQSARELAREQRQQMGLSVLMLDIDKFKAINDTYGHAVGDEAIRHLVDQTKATLRAVDILGRLGGEEFAVLLPEATEDKAERAAERIRSRIESAELLASSGDRILFTISIGISAVRAGDESIEAALNRADAALYVSKKTGRNRATLYTDGMDAKAA